jgi:hypothetical protein
MSYEDLEEKDFLNRNNNYINNLYSLLDIVTKNICISNQNVINTKDELNYFLKTSDPLKVSTQEILSCLVKNVFKDYKKSKGDIPLGTIDIQKLFYPIENLSEGDYGITYLTGYKDSKPFAILKATSSSSYTGHTNLHDIVIGLVLNQLRDKTPNFMYVYGGFYCSGLIDIGKVNRKNKIEKEVKKIRKRFTNGIKKYLQEEENLFIEFTDNELDFNNYINKLKDLLNESIIDDLKDSEEVFTLYKNMQKLTYESSENLCVNNNRILTLMLSEYIKGDFLGGLYDLDLSDDNWNKIILQIFLSLFIAFKEYNFIHGDLHNRNILVREFEEEKELNYEFTDYNNEYHKYKIKSKYVPQIIDYGMAYINYKNIKIESEEIFGIDTVSKAKKEFIRNDLKVFGRSLPDHLNYLSEIKDFDELFELIFNLAKIYKV